MAVPITGAKLSDVKTNIEGGGGGTVTSLKDAIDNEAATCAYDPTYVIGGYDSLKDFRGYNHVITPSVPTGLAETSDTDTSISMSWNSSVGATSYQIRIDSTTTIYDGASLSHTETGLTCDETSYDFQVRATNCVGSSSWSTIVPMATAPDTTPPNAVTDAAQTLAGTTTATVAYTNSVDACTGLLGYEHFINGVSVGVSGTLGSVNLTSLSAGQSYTYQNEAYDFNNNHSAKSNLITIYTAPIAPTLTNDSITSVNISNSWTSPTGADLYEYEYKATSSGTWLNSSDDISPATISDLASDTSYDFRVRASNNGWWGAWSTTLTVSTDPIPDTIPPSTVTGLASGTVTTTSIPYTWNAATDNVGVVQYELVTSAGGFIDTVTGTPPATSYSRTGLSAGTTYTAKVRAKDAANNYSVAYSNVDTTCTLCIAPTLVYVSKTSDSVTLSWVAVTGASSYKLYYRATSASVYLLVGTVTSPTTKTGLVPSTSYDFIVTAVNCDGIESADSNKITQTTDSGVISVSMTNSSDSTALDACNSYPGDSTTRWYDGSGGIANGDIIYTDSGGTTELVGSNQYYSDGTNSFRVTNVGLVFSLAACSI